MGCSNEMLPVAWGWKISKSGLTPIQTDLLPAPEDLLKVIRCGCTADCGIVVCDIAAGKMGLNVLWLAVIVKVLHAKMQVFQVSQMMKKIVNNVLPVQQFVLLICMY